MDDPSEHQCKIKEKLAELAEEIKLWEDDVGRSPIMTSLDAKPVFKKPESNSHCRDSLAKLDITPVSKIKARFECLAGKENSKPVTMKFPVAHSFPKKEVKSYFSPIIKNKVDTTTTPATERPTVIDVPRGSISQAERSRLERMNELENLRKRHMSEKVKEAVMVQTSLPTPPSLAVGYSQDGEDEKPSSQPCDVPTESEHIDSGDAEYALPSPPPLPISGDLVDGGNTPVPLPLIADIDICLTTGNSIQANTPGFMEISQKKMAADLDLPISLESGIQSTSDEVILPSELDEFNSADDSISSNDVFVKHDYYTRPTFSTKRRYEETEGAEALPRQRSVTFLPPHGAAPGDTTSEGTAFDMESEISSSDADSQLCRPQRADSQSVSLSSFGESAKVYGGSADGDLTSITSSETAFTAASDIVSLSSYVAATSQSIRRANSSAAEIQRRRRERLDELPILVEAERSVILQASATLQTGSNSLGPGNSSSGGNGGSNSAFSAAMTPKRSRLHLVSQEPSALGGEGQQIPGSQTYVETSLTMLIACQRRQVLLEELTLLQAGSPVLVPPNRGEPIRARLRMSAVRLSLKVARKPGHNDGHGNVEAPGGGFVVVNQETVNGLISQHGPSGAPVRYHLIAIIKCRGEGRMFHSNMVTLMHVNDLPVGTARPVDYVDLPANIEIVPLRPDFVFTMEVYCLTVGSDSVRSLRSACQSPQLVPLVRAPGSHKRTPRPPSRQRRRDQVDISSPRLDWSTRMPPPTGTPLTRSSKKVLQQIAELGRSQQQQQSTRRRADTGPRSHLLSNCLLPTNSSPTHASVFSPIGGKNMGNDSLLASLSSGNKMAAFTLLSSVDMRYHDNWLVGRLQVPRPGSIAGEEDTVRQRVVVPTSSSAFKGGEMPLRLTRLPRSSPLSGFAGLVNASVGLEARVLNRGFITVFEEVSGLGIWRRYWCQLRADHLQFWRYPEDERRSPRRPSAPTNQSALGRIELRHIVAPRAIPAPHHICARTNTIYMRSIRSIEPDCLSASISAVQNAADSATTGSGESLIFQASPDYSWLEQKHLLCADTLEERDRWIHLLNKSLDVLKQWMPEHFACLSRLDTKLEFPQPVSTNLAALLIRGGGAAGTNTTAV